MYRACDEKGLVPQFMKKLDEFLSNKKMGIDEIDIPGATFAVEAEEIGRSTRRLITQLDSIDLENVSSDEDLVKDLKRLHRLLGKKLEDALLVKPMDRDEI